MRIVVDTQRCSGHARCAAVAPTIYQLDDDGYCIADGRRVSEDEVALAQRGARACPERVIRLIDDVMPDTDDAAPPKL